MAFEDFSQLGILDGLSDPGPVHILERGRLRSTPGYEQRSPKRKKHCVIDLSWQRDLHVAPKKDQSNGLPDITETKCTQNVPLLKKLCVHFVAHHIHLVESLIDFPDIIGKEIFGVLCEIGAFKQGAFASENTISLFSEAYHNELLSSMCLKKGHLFIEKTPNIVPMFPYLEGLDVSWCKIKDDSEILEHIGQLLHLKKLSLQGNMLTSRGIQKLTAPFRMFETGLHQLAHLDLSGNMRISRGVEKYLKWFNLESLNLSGTLIGVQSIKDLEISLEMTHFEFEEFHHYDIINNGWAAPVVTQWIEDCVAENEARETARYNGLTNFYTKKKPPDVNDTVVVSPESIFPRIHLMRVDRGRNVQTARSYKSLKTSGKDHRGLCLDDVVEDVTKDHGQGETEIDFDSDQENSPVVHKLQCNTSTSQRIDKADSVQTKVTGLTVPLQPTLKELHLERQSRLQNRNKPQCRDRHTHAKKDHVKVAAGFDTEDWDLLSGYL